MSELQKKESNFQQLSPEEQQSILELLKKNNGSTNALSGGSRLGGINMPPLKVKKKDLPREDH